MSKSSEKQKITKDGFSSSENMFDFHPPNIF